MALTALDRCDRCMAQAVATVDHLEWPTMLMMCGHHLTEHRDALAACGAVVFDERTEAQVSSW